ncbi:MAG: mechanosensitive ion channel [Actinomycetota bacterium]|nr:mechanosensitive ion channel [Actinomycetota bacterium]
MTLLPSSLAAAAGGLPTGRIVAAAAAFIGALVVVEVAYRGGRVLLRRSSAHNFCGVLDRGRWAARLLAVSIAGVETVRLAPTSTHEGLSEAARIGIVFASAWLAMKATGVLEVLAEGRFDVSIADNRRARKARTQLLVLRRVLNVAIVVLALLAALTALPQARTLGASLLASAGVLGIVAGIAGQSTLGNMIAGLQIAFSDSLRLNDVVVVTPPSGTAYWGTIEELTLTYVVIAVWDQRRLVLPVSYFVTTPFENWTRQSSQLLGSVHLFLDYRAPMDELRSEFQSFVEGNPLWDRRVAVLQVVEATEQSIQLRALVSARSGSNAWDLRCAVREHLISYVRNKHPEALPRTRFELAGGSDRDDADEALAARKGLGGG